MESNAGKVFLFFVSLGLGAFFAWLAYSPTGGFTPLLFATGCGSLTSVLYILIGAFAVRACEALKGWAFPADPGEKITPWTANIRASITAIWPLSLPFWILLSVFFAVINRLFR